MRDAGHRLLAPAGVCSSGNAASAMLSPQTDAVDRLRSSRLPSAKVLGQLRRLAQTPSARVHRGRIPHRPRHPGSRRRPPSASRILRRLRHAAPRSPARANRICPGSTARSLTRCADLGLRDRRFTRRRAVRLRARRPAVPANGRKRRRSGDANSRSACAGRSALLLLPLDIAHRGLRRDAAAAAGEGVAAVGLPFALHGAAAQRSPSRRPSRRANSRATAAAA